MKRKGKKKSRRVTVKAVQATEDKPFDLPKVDARPDVDEEPWGEDGLTTRQRSFVEALIGPAGGIASKAAQMAGYRDDNNNALRATASYLLTIPNVQEAIALAFARRRMTPEWAQERLLEIASASMRNFASVDADGKLMIDWKKAADAGAIGQIREIREDVIESGGKSEVIKRSFKLHDVVGALRTVLKLSGLLKDESVIRLTGEHGGPVNVAHAFDHAQHADLYRRMLAERSSGGADRDGSDPSRPERN